jgi:hypothetical protein
MGGRRWRWRGSLAAASHGGGETAAARATGRGAARLGQRRGTARAELHGKGRGARLAGGWGAAVDGDSGEKAADSARLEELGHGAAVG